MRHNARQGTQGNKSGQRGQEWTWDIREHKGQRGQRRQQVRLWSVYVIFTQMFGPKIRTLFFLLNHLS